MKCILICNASLKTSQNIFIIKPDIFNKNFEINVDDPLVIVISIHAVYLIFGFTGKKITHTKSLSVIAVIILMRSRKGKYLDLRLSLPLHTYRRHQ